MFLLHCEERDDGSVAHAAFRVGDSVIEVSSATEQWPAVTNAIHIFVPDADQAYERAVAEHATTLYEPADMPYGERSAGVRDGAGNNWYIATHLTGKYDV